ncbi:hypothetical protein [Streptomyces sp. NPDC086787]|uniref:hypothetical protein n=1 Tax=Streptomyces sp. NPDC086787 TaxID=3365759 RepID=UPI00381D0210
MSAPTTARDPAYREIGEWPLAQAISDALEGPAPDSHVRALVGVAGKQGHEPVARWYAELRRHGQETGQRVTAQVVANLADFLRSGSEPDRLETLFVPRQLPPATTGPDKPVTPAGGTGGGIGEPLTGTLVTRSQESLGPHHAADLLVRALTTQGWRCAICFLETTD